MYVLRQSGGVLWTNSSVTTERGATYLQIQVKGAGTARGFVETVGGRPASVALDGQILSSNAYTYDPTSGVLRVEYPHDRTHVIRVEFSTDSSSGTSLPGKSLP
jgi:hypothetical protein